MAWADISEDLFEVFAQKLAPRHLKSLHLVNRRFRELVRSHLRHLAPRNLHLEATHSFPDAVSLDLSRCWNEVNDLRLVALSKIYSRAGYTALKSIDLSKCHAVTDRGIAGLVENLPHLEELNLAGCRSPLPVSYIGYTGVSGETLRGLRNLKRLHMRWNPITDHSIHSILALQHLTYLDLGECHGVSGASLASLGRLGKMEVLNLERTMVSLNGVRALMQMPRLTSLSLRNCAEIDDAALALLAQLRSLTDLNLGKLNNITDDGVQRLIRLTKLQVLDLTYCCRLNGSWIVGDAVEERHWPLTSLKLEDCCNWVTDEVLREMSVRMPHLQEVNLQNCVRITKTGLESLCICPLTILNLSRCYGVGDSELSILSRVGSLVHVNLAYCAQVTDDGLSALQQLPGLESLLLNCCPRVTTSGIRSLQSLRHSLKRLDIRACHGVETDALFFISNWFDQMEILDLSYLAVSNTQFRALKNLKNLTRVSIRGCHALSQEMLKEFWYLEGITDSQVVG